MLCECGCGTPVKRARQSDSKRGHKKGEFCRFAYGHNGRRGRRRAGYGQLFIPDHPNASAKGLVYEHVIIAERALGRFLPSGAEVHHVDRNSLNNARGNLVICQDKAYHKLLHYRQRLTGLGADPGKEKICSFCHARKPLAEFGAMRSNKATGRQSACRDCMNTHRADSRKKRRLGAEHGVYVPAAGEVEVEKQ